MKKILIDGVNGFMISTRANNRGEPLANPELEMFADEPKDVNLCIAHCTEQRKT
jgi:hypothetical protein